MKNRGLIWLIGLGLLLAGCGATAPLGETLGPAMRQAAVAPRPAVVDDLGLLPMSDAAGPLEGPVVSYAPGLEPTEAAPAAPTVIILLTPPPEDESDDSLALRVQAQQAAAQAWQAQVQRQQELQAQQKQADQLEDLNREREFQAEQQQWQNRWVQPPPPAPSAMPGRLSNYPY